MIVITTPTGDIGAQVLDRILDSGDADAITKALEGADRLFWLVPPRPFTNPGSAEHYYLDFTRPAAQAAASQGVRVVGVSTLGHGYQGKAGVLSAALAMDNLIEGTGAAYRALALPFFMENLLRQIQEIKDQGTFSMANTADRPLPTIATRDVAAVAAALLLDTSWSGQTSVPLTGPDNLTPDDMAGVISHTLGSTIRYRQVPVADLQAMMQRRGASQTMAQDMADMIEAQNNGIYDAEPRDPNSATATSLRQWCHDTLKPAVQA
jgi:uncharacterized protein YbjT (DUF2867 family)